MFGVIKELILLWYTKEKILFLWSCVFMTRRGGRRIREFGKDEKESKRLLDKGEIDVSKYEKQKKR